ncbi:GNAT family N-acetyltransferase [Aquabacterium sp.]|uniref:GNAT family N-acetyltransferase n=1 Tax=Aquabacterium sp. TaxID=1872578 RepID=UPI002BE12FB7|nr:GNAT family N-acetyltransferase [Aquabacterium sp.]HSW07264.1 GNAT family N-acetyltransferase [Aquabacterium sp.]
MSSLTLQAADAVAAADLHAAFGAAFADYLIGPFTLQRADWPVFLARQAVDLRLSRIAEQQGRILAFALVAARPAQARWRLATMGAVPQARGSGAAPQLLDDFVARARAAGQAAVELEVFAQNERALRLYRGRGFAPVHELHGYVLRRARCDGPVPAVVEVELPAAWVWLDEAMQQLPDLPLQVTPAGLAASPQPLQAWQHGQAQLVFAEQAGGTVMVHSLVDRDAGQHDAQALVQALMARHAGRDMLVPQLQRLDLGGQALRRLGFVPHDLHQLWMRLDLVR